MRVGVKKPPRGLLPNKGIIYNFIAKIVFSYMPKGIFFPKKAQNIYAERHIFHSEASMVKFKAVCGTMGLL